MAGLFSNAPSLPPIRPPTLFWQRCGGGTWYGLDEINLEGTHPDNLGGVYVIFTDGAVRQAVRVGQGNVWERLSKHRADEAIQAYRYSNLRVTWAVVPKFQRNGVEAYLAEQMRPLVGERFPNVRPIPVNLPWQQNEDISLRLAAALLSRR